MAFYKYPTDFCLSGEAERRGGLREQGLVRRDDLRSRREEGMLVSREKLGREKGYLINEGSPPYYRGARVMQNQVTCVK